MYDAAAQSTGRREVERVCWYPATGTDNDELTAPEEITMRHTTTIFLAAMILGWNLGCSHHDPNARDGWKPLFNGSDLAGWEALGQARWEVVDGQLVGTQGPNREPGDLMTVDTYDDFDLVVSYKAVWPLNSGVWYRYQSEKQACQADILEYANPVAYTGSVYCMGKAFVAINLDPQLEDRKGWNTLRILAKADHVRVWLNGTPTADIREDSTLSGRIGFQVHAGDEFAGMKLIVREIRIKPLGVAE
jgi:hypothetical protein